MGGLIQKVFNTSKSESFEDITQQLYLKNVELAHTNQTLALLRNIDIHVLDSRNTISSLASLISDELMIANNYIFLCIITKSEVSENDFLVNDIRSSATSKQDRLQHLYKQAVLKHGIVDEQENMVEIDVSPNATQGFDFLESNELAASFSRDVTALGLSRLIVTRVRSNESTRGLIITGYTDLAAITEVEKKFLSRISEAFGVALDNKFLDIKLLRTAHKLRISNAKLKELDKSKDDFISMASHQLRTPLTSVKGYISMVLEGDMGKITTQQRQVLEQAYDSSQRMVFLIGDFLNVSRIQTGKFEIEKSTINFTHLVDEEVDQLKETARMHGMTLVYEKPETEHVAVGDENKLRQVMMNFIDNAIFYSPKGSTINVRLYREATGLVFKVIDQGIGVPKEAQAKLFTKFFRAANARQQRPDGTGIGLYMAKKVIVAHGGSIIFETKEGVGSTFGFKLPLENDLKKSSDEQSSSTNNASSDSA